MQQNLEVDKKQAIGGTAYLNCICNFSNIFVTFVVCIVLYFKPLDYFAPGFLVFFAFIYIL